MPVESTANGCECGNDDLLATIDKNLAPSYMSGNKYCRYCDDCGRRYYCSKSYFQSADEQYAIPEGDDEPVPLFDCPACGDEVMGTPDTCPHCDRDYVW